MVKENILSICQTRLKDLQACTWELQKDACCKFPVKQNHVVHFLLLLSFVPFLSTSNSAKYQNPPKNPPYILIEWCQKQLSCRNIFFFFNINTSNPLLKNLSIVYSPLKMHILSVFIHFIQTVEVCPKNEFLCALKAIFRKPLSSTSPVRHLPKYFNISLILHETLRKMLFLNNVAKKN